MQLGLGGWNYLWRGFEAFAQWNIAIGGNFLADIARIIGGQGSEIFYVDAIFNWAFGTDLLFSACYLLFAIGALAASRSRIVREVVANALQAFVDHPRGPIAAFAALVAASVVLLEKLTK